MIDRRRLNDDGSLLWMLLRLQHRGTAASHHGAGKRRWLTNDRLALLLLLL